MRLWDTPGIHRSLPTYTPLLNIYRPTRAYYGIYSSLREYTPSPFYNVIRTESTPISCLDKRACSRRHIYRAYRAYISSLGTQCVQSIRTVTVPPTRGCSILDVTNLCADLGLEVGLVDLLCPSRGCERTQRTLPPSLGPAPYFLVQAIPQNIVQKLTILSQQDLARLEHLYNISNETTYIFVNICINIV